MTIAFNELLKRMEKEILNPIDGIMLGKSLQNLSLIKSCLNREVQFN